MPEAEVTREGAQPTEAGRPQAGDKVELSRQEFEALRRERDEARESERFWATQARRGGQEAAEVAEEPEEAIETADLVPAVTGNSEVDEAIFGDPDKWAEAVSKGPKAIDAFIRKAGYVTGTEAAEIARKVAARTVEVERQKMGTDAAIIRDFPDLANKNSEHFKQTSVELKKLVALDPKAARTPSTLYAAAEIAKAKMDAKSGGGGRGRQHDDYEIDRYDRYDPEEEDRRLRAAAQDGTRGRTRDLEDDMDGMGPEAREMCRQMGIDEKDWQTESRALKGSQPQSRRR